jgi:surfeit locus 1 family protein
MTTETPTAKTVRRGFPWILTVVCAVLLAVLLTLGVWQVQRLQWKIGLMDAADAAAALPPAPLETVLGGDQATQFRRVIVDCPGLSTAAFVELQSIQDGDPGVRLISTCPLLKEQGDASLPDVVLVDRGFVAADVSARPPVALSGTMMRIEGVLRDTPPPGPMAVAAEGNHFYARDNAAMARALNVTNRVAPQTLYAVTSSNPEWTALRPSAPPAAFSNNHLGYALTWFGLAIALVGFYIAIVRRRPQAASLRERGGRGKRKDTL